MPADFSIAIALSQLLDLFAAIPRALLELLFASIEALRGWGDGV